MARHTRRESRAARRARGAPPEGKSAALPRLRIDFALAALVLGLFAYDARETLNPDGVAYLENAEAIATGYWSAAIQGYWSPGFSLLLAPLVRAMRDDRAVLLGMVHLFQYIAGVGALWLAVLVAHHRVPGALQRVAFWIAAWTVIVLLSPELVTPDLLLCTCLLGAMVLHHQPARWAPMATGVLAGCIFLLKTSSWPWLFAGALLALRPAWRLRSMSLVPWRTLTPAGALIAAWLLVLGVHEGRPTLGSVGPLNAGWYLGDGSRRAPDTDLGPHARYRQTTLASGATVTFADLRDASETYLPWSDPERWAQGFPVGSQPRLSVQRAMETWTANVKYAARWLLPLALALAACLALSGVPAQRARPWQWLEERPLFTTGVVAMAVFLAIHTEGRLVAPAVLLCAFGALTSALPARRSVALRVTSGLFVAGLLASIGMFLIPRHGWLPRNAESLQTERTYLRQHMTNAAVRGAIVIGPAMPWMPLLWMERLRVVAQFGAAGSNAVLSLPGPQRDAWLRATFGRDASAYAAALVTISNGRAYTTRKIEAW